MKQMLLIVLFAFVIALSKAQSLPASIVSSAGGESIASTGALEWTLGEIMTETFLNNEYLTQGFHQPATIIITNIETSENEISIYPNPTRSVLYLKTETNCNCEIRLYDAQGRQLISTTKAIPNDHN